MGFAGASLPHQQKSRFSGIPVHSGQQSMVAELKRPDYRNEKRTDCQDKKIQRDTELQIVTKTIPTGSIYQQIGLITDRRCKTGARSKTDRNDERFRIHAHTDGDRNGDGKQKYCRSVIAQNLCTDTRQQ